MKKHALLIGVEDYRDKMISRLNYARSDAIALAERLENRCGFDHVRVLVEEDGEDEPTLVNIVTALRDTAVELSPDDLFLFFFAGHGLERDGKGYLLARDSLQVFPEHGSLSLELLRKSFGSLEASQRIMLFDACRNSPDAVRADDANCMSDEISRDIVAAVRTYKGKGATTVLLSACKSGQRAYEWPRKGHGVFTHYLLNGLDGEAWDSGTLDFDKLALYTADHVSRWTAHMPGLTVPQEPWYAKFGAPNSILLADQVGANSSKQSFSLPRRNTNNDASQNISDWWIEVDDWERGPLSCEEMREGIINGSIKRETLCWRKGMEDWKPVDKTIQWYKYFIESNSIMQDELSSGELVRVIKGPFTDFVGAVQEINYKKNIVTITVNMFGKETSVHVDVNQVESVYRKGTFF